MKFTSVRTHWNRAREMAAADSGSRRRRSWGLVLSALACGLVAGTDRIQAQTYVQLTEVPDYTWYAGCFGTASGNLMGYWDRHGLPDLYTGPTGGGVAPLDTWSSANKGIRSMWASKAGFDGRPANRPGHIDDYWVNYSNDNSYSYESTAADPYVTAGRTEHAPDCIGDYIGLSQKKWNNLAGECDGNIDAYSFVFWDKTGQRHLNYSYTNTTGQYIPDIQSGFRAWAKSRGYDADVFTQLTSFNPERTGTGGFTYADVKAEIKAGYPVLCFLQPKELYRALPGPPAMARANPEIHGVMIYGYIDEPGLGVPESVLIRTSWGLGTDSIQPWAQADWLGLFPVRGVIGFHPKPKITGINRSNGMITIDWEGPGSLLTDMSTGQTGPVHLYQLESSPTLQTSSFRPVGTPTTARSVTVPECCDQTFFRLRLVPQ